MKKFLAVLLCLLPCVAQAQTQKTRAALITEINANFADNTTGNITPAQARATYNDMISSLAIIAATGIGDAAYTILPTDRYVYTTTVLTAARVWTLPAANSLNKGEAVVIIDAAAGVNASNTLTLARAGTDTINGSAASLVLVISKSFAIFVTDGVSNWGEYSSQSLALTAGQIVGTATNDNAAAGNVGQYLTAQGTNTPTSGTVADITSISLSAGDWECQGNIQTNTGGNIVGGSVWLSTTSATDPTFPNDGAYLTANVPPSTNVRTPIGTRRFSLAATTTVFISENIAFTVSNTNTGFIRCRRAR